MCVLLICKLNIGHIQMMSKYEENTLSDTLLKYWGCSFATNMYSFNNWCDMIWKCAITLILNLYYKSTHYLIHILALFGSIEPSLSQLEMLTKCGNRQRYVQRKITEQQNLLTVLWCRNLTDSQCGTCDYSCNTVSYFFVSCLSLQL